MNRRIALAGLLAYRRTRSSHRFRRQTSGSANSKRCSREEPAGASWAGCEGRKPHQPYPSLHPRQRKPKRKPPPYPKTFTAGALGPAKDRSVRFQAIHGLAKIGGEESAEALATALSDHDPAVRLQTVLALQRIGDVGTVGVLTKVLGDDEDPEVRRVAVRTLERMGGDEAWWALFDATSDPHPTVREAANAAIGRSR